MLSTFILEPCNAPALTINPIILKVARESAGASVDICVPGEVGCASWVASYSM